MQYLRSSKNEVGPACIESLETKFELCFPNDYKQFLLKNNGGFCSSEDNRFDDAMFFYLEAGPSSLKEAIYERDNHDFIPIGLTLNEDPIHLHISGSVYHDGEKVADSFESFLSKYLIPIAEQ